jgi:lactoylglutathione lyase
MKLIKQIEQPEAKFDLYFMAYDDEKSLSHGKHWSDREGLIELTHNYVSFFYQQHFTGREE